MYKIVKNDKGIALVTTIAIVAILVTAALQINKVARDSVAFSKTESDQFYADQIALSSINLASMILVEDASTNNIDSVQEVWADEEKLKTAINGLGFGKDVLTIKITDELSKIQINALIQKFPGNQFNEEQNKIWENFLNLYISSDKAEDERDPSEIINSVKDWLDSEDDDAVTGISGAESDYYLGLDPPFVCANGPFNHVQELLNIKGVTKDLLYNKNTETIEDQDKGQDQDQDQAGDFSDVFTVYGLDEEKSENRTFKFSGQVNINTADVDILAALLPAGMEDLAQDLVDFREQKTEQGDDFVNSLDKGWYEKVIDLSQDENKKFENTIRYSSNIFKVECTAQKNTAKTTLIAFLKREKLSESGAWICRMIQMERK